MLEARTYCSSVSRLARKRARLGLLSAALTPLVERSAPKAAVAAAWVAASWACSASSEATSACAWLMVEVVCVKVGTWVGGCVGAWVVE